MTALPPPRLDPITNAAARAWAGRGDWIDVDGLRVFVVDLPAVATDPATELEPVLVLHGFPSSSFDWRDVVGTMAPGRRIVLLDFLGFGLSDKPDRRYGLRLHADTTEAVAAALGLDRVALVTHDMGDSVGGELLARDLEGSLSFAVTRRVLSNGSIYLDLAQLTTGQQMLLGLDDAPFDPAAFGIDPAEAFGRGLAGVFAEATPPSADELEAQWQLMALHAGNTLMPRTIRYLEDRRLEEARFTGAIETHPSPLTIVWGDLDPVARYAMTTQLVARRPGTPLITLEGIGHYPMIEDPAGFARAVASGLER